MNITEWESRMAYLGLALSVLGACATDGGEPARTATPHAQAEIREALPAGECETTEDCVQEGTCQLSAPNCVPRASYAQVHCAPEPEGTEPLRVPGFTCGCVEARCIVDQVYPATEPGYTEYPPTQDR